MIVTPRCWRRCCWSCCGPRRRGLARRRTPPRPSLAVVAVTRPDAGADPPSLFVGGRLDGRSAISTARLAFLLHRHLAACLAVAEQRRWRRWRARHGRREPAVRDWSMLTQSRGVALAALTPSLLGAARSCPAACGGRGVGSDLATGA